MCVRVWAHNLAPALECCSYKIITQPHCFWHLPRNSGKGEERRKHPEGNILLWLRVSSQSDLLWMWWQVYFHTNFQASPCESDISACRRCSGNSLPAEMGGLKLGEYILVSRDDLFPLNLRVLLYDTSSHCQKCLQSMVELDTEENLSDFISWRVAVN